MRSVNLSRLHCIAKYCTFKIKNILFIYNFQCYIKSQPLQVIPAEDSSW